MTTNDDDVMFHGQWINVSDGTWLIPDDLASQIKDNPPKPGTLFGIPVIESGDNNDPAIHSDGMQGSNTIQQAAGKDCAGPTATSETSAS